ncbi:hypothetical protein BWQ96_03867 [Gracilariopsis chorda]|uniref:Protein kinase domain-containing protein n=1 Tax=Gracilariopsis chorda TaxID=448386 RepID=A0A2V3IW49_9FLOR|nr:hypothetical protein BWQ96_03867 [Gracilariopsis chorda]|eukprot:PXF46368.1 hypothetical protein BWQ96_03867 [Gracilariopsis chorda]
MASATTNSLTRRADHAAKRSVFPFHGEQKLRQSPTISVVSQDSSGDAESLVDNSCCRRMISDILSTGSTADADEYVPSCEQEEVEGFRHSASNVISRTLHNAHVPTEPQRAYNPEALPACTSRGQKPQHYRSSSGQVNVLCSSSPHRAKADNGQALPRYMTSLADELKALRKARTQLNYVSFARIASQVCTRMCELHEENCVLGAVKPSQVLLSEPIQEDGMFPSSGVARIDEPSSSESVSSNREAEKELRKRSDSASACNSMVSTTTAGEGEESWAQKAADVFSFGMLMYEMLTLREPQSFVQASQDGHLLVDGQRLTFSQNGDQDFGGEISEKLRRLVEQCLVQNPCSRPTARDIVVKLNDLIISAATVVRHGEGDNSASRARRPSPPPRQAAFPSVIGMQQVLPAPSAEPALATTDDDCAEAPLIDFSELDGVSDSDQSSVISSNNGAGNGPEPRVSPVTTPEQRSPAFRDGSLFKGRMGTNALVRTRSAAPSHLPQLHLSLSALEPKKSQQSLEEQCTPKSKDTALFLESETKAAHHHHYAGKLPAPVQRIHESVLSRFEGKQKDTPPLIQSTAPRAIRLEGEYEAVPDELSFEERPAESNEPILPGDEAIEPASFSTSMTGQAPDGAPHEYATSTMSSTSLRRKCAKQAEDILDSSPQGVPGDLPSTEPADGTEHRTVHTPKRKSASMKKEMSEDQAAIALKAATTAGEYSMVLAILKRNRKFQGVVKNACIFLETICRDANLYFDFCEEGGVEEYISAVLLFGKIDMTLCEVFFRGMTALSTHADERVSHRLRGMGVPSVIIDILNCYRTDIAIQTAGCECLSLVARSGKLSQTAIATLGGPSVVYRAITQNNSSFKDVKLARASLNAIRYIAENNERAADYLVDVAALDPVASAAELFPDDGLEQDILNALEAFSFYTNGRRSIIMSSGMRALSAIMLRNREPRFLVQCCNFVRAVARWNDPECESAMLQSGISERIVSLMHQSQDIVGEEGARLSWYACYACTFLASFGARSRQRLRRIGAIETVLDVFRRRKDNAKVVHIATDALAELMKNEPESKMHAIRHNIVECLREAHDLHKDSIRVKKAIEWTLVYLNIPKGGSLGPAYGSHTHEDVMNRTNRFDSYRNGKSHPAQKTKTIRFLRFSRKKSGK